MCVCLCTCASQKMLPNQHVEGGQAQTECACVCYRKRASETACTLVLFFFGGGGQPSVVWATFASVIAVVRVCEREEGHAGMCVCLCMCVCECVFLNQCVEGG